MRDYGLNRNCLIRFRVTDEERRALSTLAAELDLSVSDTMRLALSAYGTSAQGAKRKGLREMDKTAAALQGSQQKGENMRDSLSTRVIFSVTDDLKDALQAEAASKGVSMSCILRQMIRDRYN